MMIRTLRELQEFINDKFYSESEYQREQIYLELLETFFESTALFDERIKEIESEVE